jgi:hypothetical protein
MENVITIKRKSSASEVQDCLICLDKPTKPLTCPKCQVPACNKCLQQHLLNTAEEPHCPNCRFGFSRPYLHQNFPQSFLTGPWADYRRALLWEREKAYLPEAQIAVEREKQARVLDKEIESLEAKYYQLQAQARMLHEMIYRAQHNSVRLHNNEAPLDEQEKPKQEEHKFVRKCPQTDCKGYLSTAWKCGLCENYTCRECYVVRGQERDAAHTCAPADLATAQLLAKDSKPCPKCGEFIMRSEGCSNMFCTSCKTAFNWNTMKIQVGGYIDNPHYFAWRRANGGMEVAPGAAPVCGGVPDYWISDLIYERVGPDYGMHRRDSDETSLLYNLRHTLGDIHARVGPELYNDHNVDNDTLSLRVGYLLNEKDQEAVMRSLLNRERRRERHRAIREVLDTFVAVGTDILNRFLTTGNEAMTAAGITHNAERLGYRAFWRDNTKVAKQMQQIWLREWLAIKTELENLRNFCNEALQAISTTLKCVVPQIREDYHHRTKNFAVAEKAQEEAPKTDEDPVFQGYKLNIKLNVQPPNLLKGSFVYQANTEDGQRMIHVLKHKDGTMEQWTGPIPLIQRCQGTTVWGSPCSCKPKYNGYCHNHRAQAPVPASEIAAIVETA